jgi:hypothetical protein
LSVTEAPTVALAPVSTVTTATETIVPRLAAKLTSVAVLSAVGVLQVTWFSFLGYVAYRYLP